MNPHDVDRAPLPGAAQPASLRQRLRRCLEAEWPLEEARSRAGQPAAVAALWRRLAHEGFAALAARPAEGGLREAAMVLEELGRADCAIPMLGHLLGNLLLARARSHGESLVDGRVQRRLHGGAIRMAIAFAGNGAQDQGRVAWSDGRATGLLREVDAGLQATHLMIATGQTLLVADLGAPGVSVVGSMPSVGAPSAQVRLEQVQVDVFAATAGAIADLRLLAALLHAARRCGAARRLREMALLAGTASAPMMQTPLAAGLVAVDGARLALDRAAEAFDQQRTQWRAIVAAAVAFAHETLADGDAAAPRVAAPRPQPATASW